MIVETILNAIYKVLTTVFGILPNIPELEVTNSIIEVFDTIFSNVQLIGIFVRPATIQLIIPVFLVIYNFEYVYKIVMWILRKIPMLGIQ